MELINTAPYIRFANMLCFEQQRGPSKTYDCRFLYTFKGSATLQMAGQRYAQPAVASIVMSLESVFAALAGWVLLGELLSGRELLGCAMVFAAVIIAQIPEFLKKDQPKEVQL